MDESIIDGVSRWIATSRTRRGLSHLVGGLVLGGSLAGRDLAETVAKKHQKHQKRKHHKHHKHRCPASGACGTTCCDPGQHCQNGACVDCQGQAATCQGQQCGPATNTCGQAFDCGTCAGGESCQHGICAHGAGTCTADQNICTDPNPDIDRCNNNALCACIPTTAGTSFCYDQSAAAGVQCAVCEHDADCLALGFPAGSACAEVSTGRCAGTCASGTACVAPCGTGP